MPTKDELKLVGISEKCFEGLRTIGNWCRKHPHITPTQYARRRCLESGMRFSGPMIAGGILYQWYQKGLLHRFEIGRWHAPPNNALYGYTLSELGMSRLFFLESSYPTRLMNHQEDLENETFLSE